MSELKKQFLDYTGLQKFWGIIKTNFATKSVAADYDSISFDADASSVTFKVNNCEGTTSDKIMPMATTAKAGFMSAEDKSLIETLNDKINGISPFHGLKIDGNEVALDGKRANIGLKYNASGEGADRKAYIDLVDLAYPEGTWNSITSDQYDASKKNHYAYENGGNIYYWSWSVEGEEGPKNNIGEPLLNAPVSRIDVSELVTTGLLQDADVVVSGTGDSAQMYLKLTFITADGNKDININVTDLVDIYSAGEGIEIEQAPLSGDEGGVNAEGGDKGSKRESTIKLKAATTTALGGVKTGYTSVNDKRLYKLDVDANGNAFVAVPWNNVVVNVTSNGTTNGQENGPKYLNISSDSTTTTDANGVPTTTYTFNIEASDALKNGGSVAGSSVQNVAVSKSGDNLVTTNDYINITSENMENNGLAAGKNIFVDLTNTAKASLGLANSAVQTAISASEDDITVSLVDSTTNSTYNNGKGTKAIKVALGNKTKASLGLADSAVQNISIMGKDLDKTNGKCTFTTDEAKSALGLGTAAYANIGGDIPSTGEASSATVTTTAQVKKYVDNSVKSVSDDLSGQITSAINGLDNIVEVGKSDSAAYGNAYGSGVTPHHVMIGVTQTDGLLASASPYLLSITDINDFCPLSDTDIENICKF